MTSSLGFEHQADAERFQAELRDRLAQFALTLHPDKTRLIQFGRRAAAERERAGLGKPETFDFLGFSVLQAHTERSSHELTIVWTSCVKDEGGPLGIGFQEQVSNHSKLLR